MPYSIADHLRQTASVQTRMAEQLAEVEQLADRLCRALQAGKKLVVFGNGGSAADAQHFAAEIIGRFEKERQALPAVALTTDTSILTAIGNDYSYDEVFARQVQGLVQSGDVVVAISTSGNSRSILRGVEESRRRGAWVAGLTGMSGGKLKDVVDCCIRVPSQRTAHIQETHIALIHALCARVDEVFLPASV
ncbi:MAG: D-sedoheptulose 7-phosphate isomerase [Elusimicrobiota bacterium]|jgi:D-sedoheptulose 7-phosphate isomerase